MFAPSWPLAIVGLGSAAMLLWGLAAVIPILLHLWRRRHDRYVEWGAMRFLEQAVRQTAQRLRMKQILLLALRVLLVLLMAFALADPHFEGDLSTAGTGERAPRYRILVLDTSYSMTRTDQDLSRFERAKQQALELVQQSVPGDAFSLISMGLPTRTLIGRPSFDVAAVTDEIQQLTCGHGGADLNQVVQQLDALIRQAKQERPTLPDCDVYWFTDLCRNTWESAKTEPMASRLQKLSEQARLVMVEVEAESDLNLMVTELDRLDEFVVVNQEITIVATIENSSDQSLAGVPVELWMDGQNVAQRTLQMAPRHRQSVEFHWRTASPGDHRAEIRLPDDGLLLDNRRYLVVPVRTAIRCLCVAGSDRSVDFVSTALQPAPLGTPTRVVTKIPAARLRGTDLTTYDAAFLCSVDGLDAGEVTRLHELLHRGGGVVILLGEATRLASFNRWVADPPGPQGLLPARLLGPSPRGDYHWDPRDYGYPVIRPFLGQEPSGLLTTPIWGYMRLQPLPEAAVGLWFDTGDAAIVEIRTARGRTLLVATPASDATSSLTSDDFDAWNAWAIWPSFPPMMLELLQQAINRRFEGRTVETGATLRGVAPSARSADTVTVQRDSDQAAIELPWPTQEEDWTFGDTWLTGFYRVAYGRNAPRTNELYAVNVDTSESDPRLVPWNDFAGTFLRDTDERLQYAEGAPTDETPRPIFRWLLLALLVLVLVESCLSSYHGRDPLGTLDRA